MWLRHKLGLLPNDPVLQALSDADCQREYWSYYYMHEDHWHELPVPPEGSDQESDEFARLEDELREIQATEGQAPLDDFEIVEQIGHQ